MGAEFDPNAPWNEVDDVYETCSECGGDGGVWFDEDGKEFTLAEYKKLPKEHQELCEFDVCLRCDGLGTVVVENNEPDWEDW